jgi:hypothetical protein
MTNPEERTPGSTERPVSGSGFASAPAGTISQELIVETRNQIRSLVDEITALSESQCSLAEFYDGFLTRVVQALAAVGGAVWQVDEGGNLQLEFQINLAATGVTANEAVARQHGAMVSRLLAAGQPVLVPPQSGGDNIAGNPTDYLLVVGPLVSDQTVVGIVEIFQRPEGGPSTQRGYLRFVVQMCKLAGNYLKSHHLRQFGHQQSLWQRLQQFVRVVHQSLDVKKTLYAIANEGRRVVECDRASVALWRGGRCKVEAVSGLDSIERRADQVKRLGQLVTAVVRGGQPLWYTGDGAGLPPQIDDRLHDYLDTAHSKLLAVIPLLRWNDPSLLPAPGERRRREEAPEPIGALVIEQLADTAAHAALVKRVDTVVEHSRMALTNALDHHHIFLGPLWRALGRSSVAIKARNLPKTLLILGGIVGLLVALFLIPYPFTLGANGQLTPVERHEIYAEVDGVLEEILVPDDPAAIVEEGQVLARMSNSDLQLEFETLQGEWSTSQAQAERLERALRGRSDAIEPLDRIQLDGQLAEIQHALRSLEGELQIKRQQLAALDIKAPARGHVVNWQVRQNLLRRPVQRGQNLMTVIDPTTEWQVELELPERRVAHLMRAWEEADAPLSVTFSLASRPGHQFTGTLIEIDKKIDVRSDEGNAALLRVALDESDFDPELLRAGTRVTAKVHAGRESIGYVWLHELLETIRGYWQYWF